MAYKFSQLNQTQGSLANRNYVQPVAGASAQVRPAANTAVLDANIGPNTPKTPPPPANNPTSGGSGGGTGGGGNTTPAGQAPDTFLQLINDAYNARMGDLNSQEGTLNNQQGSIVSDINSSADTSKNSLTSNLAQSQSQIDQSGAQGGQRKEDALSAARRLYSELSMGGQQRFGGASSAGEAYSALTGRELQRNNQQITTDYNAFMGQVSQARQTVQAKYDDAVAQLENQRQLALNQAQRDFQDKISQINSLKSQAAGDKASQQMQALQNLRNQVYNINLATAQNNQNIQQFKTQAETELQNATQAFSTQTGNAQGGLNSFSTNASTNPQTTLAFGNTQGGPGALQTGQVASQNPKDDEFFNRQLFA